MNHIIFIRSYRGDIEWLKYCIRSIEKYVKNVKNVVCVVPSGDHALFEDLAGIELRRSPAAHLFTDDYLGQQCDKLYAFQYGNGLITYVDSDCVFTEPTDMNDLLTDGKPTWLMTPYSVLGNEVPWKPITENALKQTVEFEFMRRMPLSATTKQLMAFGDWFHQTHGKSMAQYIRAQPYRQFSEFNALGAWLYQYRRDEINWINTETTPLPKLIVKQFWSWGGIDKHRVELEEIVK